MIANLIVITIKFILTMKLTKDQVRQTLVSPIMHVNHTRSDIDSTKENYVFCSPGLDGRAQTGKVVIDAAGHVLKIKNVFPVGPILFLTSLKYVCPLRECDLMLGRKLFPSPRLEFNKVDKL